jgi:cytochrome c-type biogenesis protein CcmH/NrfF
MTELVKTFRLWLAAFVVVFVTIFTTGATTSTVERRIAHLESIVRCPACEGLSVAQSNATSSIAVRHEIERRVQAGDSDTSILTSLQDRYGSAILLTPSSRGLGVLLWIVPFAAIALGVVILRRVVRSP